MGCVRSRRGGVQGLRTPIHEACALPPHPPPPTYGTPAQVALGPANVWPRHLVMNLQMNRTTPLSFSQRSGHALPHSSFSLFNNEAQNGKGTQLQGPSG